MLFDRKKPRKTPEVLEYPTSHAKSLSGAFVCADVETWYDTKSVPKLSVARGGMSYSKYAQETSIHCAGLASIDDEQGHVCAFPTWIKGSPFPVKTDNILIGMNTLFDATVFAARGVMFEGHIDVQMVARAVIPGLRSYSLDSLIHELRLGAGKFDGGKALLALDGIKKPSLDQLQALAKYAADDAVKCCQIFQMLRPYVPTSMLLAIDWSIKCYLNPQIALNATVLRDGVDAEEARIADVLRKAGISDRSSLMSNPQFADLLRAAGAQPPTKISKTTGKQTYAFAKTDKDFTDLLDHEGPQVRALVAARLGTKSTIEKSRLTRLLEHAGENDGYEGQLRVPLRAFGAHTGRYSGVGANENINVQNIPSASVALDAMEAPRGHMLINVDAAQIEARIAVTLAGEVGLIQAFANGDDVYAKVASDIYGRKITKESDPEARQQGKVSVLMLNYRSGAGVYQNTTRLMSKGKIILSDAEAKQGVQAYRNTYPRFNILWNTLDASLATMASGGTPLGLSTAKFLTWKPWGVRMPNGFWLQYPELRRSQLVEDRNGIVFNGPNGVPKHIHGGSLLENLCQGLAAVIVEQARLRVAEELGLEAAMMVHDSLVYVVPESVAQETLGAVKILLGAQVPWWPELPLAASGGLGKTYKQAKQDQ